MEVELQPQTKLKARWLWKMRLFHIFCCWDILKHWLKIVILLWFLCVKCIEWNAWNKLFHPVTSFSNVWISVSQNISHPRLSFFFFHIYQSACLSHPTMYWWLHLSSDHEWTPFSLSSLWSLLSQTLLEFPIYII